MNTQSFSASREMSLPTSRTIISPYDSDLKFNRIIESKPGDSSRTIRSIDAAKMLRTLEDDKLSDLFRITLAGRTVRNGTGMWDTFFNNSVRYSMTAAVVMAEHDYSVIPQYRVVTASQYLNMSMSVSRMHLNQAKIGDTVGVAIRDMARNIVYVLLYVIDEFCSVTEAPSDKNGRPNLIPSMNLTMNHALMISADGKVNLVDMMEGVEYNEVTTTPFVQGLTNIVYDVSNGFPWKPHYLPVALPPHDRITLETPWIDPPTSTNVSYDEFETICRDVYNRAKQVHLDKKAAKEQEKTQTQDRRRGGKGVEKVERNVRPVYDLPIVEIVSLNNATYLARFAGNVDDKTIYSFTHDDLGNHVITETYLTNEDLKNALISETPSVMVMSDQFGPNAYLRNFTLNF